MTASETLRKRQRAGTATPNDYARLGLDTPEVLRAKRITARNDHQRDRLFRYVEAAQLWANGELDAFEIAGDPSGDLVAVADWNERTRQEYVGPVAQGFLFSWIHGPQRRGTNPHHMASRRVVECDRMARLGNLFERVGVRIEWSDMFLRCGCGKGICTEPSWGELDYWVGDGDYACCECLENSQCPDCELPTQSSYGHHDQRDEGHCHCSCDCQEEEEEEEEEDSEEEDTD